MNPSKAAKATAAGAARDLHDVDLHGEPIDAQATAVFLQVNLLIERCALAESTARVVAGLAFSEADR